MNVAPTDFGVFNAIDAHPWVGTRLSGEPWQWAILQIFEELGGQVQVLGVPEIVQFDAASALINYILGLAGQYAAGARLLPRGTDRKAFLKTVATRWSELGPRGAPVHAPGGGASGRS